MEHDDGEDDDDKDDEEELDFNLDFLHDISTNKKQTTELIQGVFNTTHAT